MRRTTQRRYPIAACTLPLAMLLAALSGCNTPNGPVNVDADAARRAKDEAAAGSSVALQNTLMGFADTYTALISQASDNLMVMDRTAQRRVLATRMKLDGAEAVVEIVTGANPKVALLDLAVMVTIQREVWHDFWEPNVFGADQSYNYRDALERLEKEIWAIAANNLSEQEVADLRQLAKEIRQQYITQVFVTNLRASEISRQSTEGGATVQAPPSLLAVLGLDPLAGLSPAVVEVTKARLLAERGFFYAQKLPELLGWRIELLTAETMSVPETEKALANVDEAVKSATRLAAVAEALPTTIETQRSAALEQASEIVSNEVGRMAVILSNERSALLDGVAQERDALIKAFDERHTEAQAVLADVRSTITAADQLSQSVHGAVEAISAMMAPTPGAPSAQPGRPFDIREYQQTLASASGTLRELKDVVQGATDLMTSPKWAERERMLKSAADDLEHRARKIVVIAAAAFGVALLLGLSGAFVVKRMVSARTA